MSRRWYGVHNSLSERVCYTDVQTPLSPTIAWLATTSTLLSSDAPWPQCSSGSYAHCSRGLRLATSRYSCRGPQHGLYIDCATQPSVGSGIGNSVSIARDQAGKWAMQRG